MIETEHAAQLIIFIVLVFGATVTGICAKLASVIAERNKLAIENSHLKGLMKQEVYAGVQPKQLARPND